MTVESISIFIHILAGVTWVGGIIYMVLVLLPSLGTIEPASAGALMGGLSKRFTRVAWTSIILLILTGGMQIQPGTLFDFSSQYGTFLTIKLSSALIMILVALYITFSLFPKVRKLAPAPGEEPSAEFISLQGRIPMLVKINVILGILVIFSVSMLY